MATVINNINLQLFSAMDSGDHFELDEDTVRRIDLLNCMYGEYSMDEAVKVALITELDRIATAQERAAQALNKTVNTSVRIANALERIAKHMEPGNA